MEKAVPELKIQLAKCREILNVGYSCSLHSGINWLHKFCVEFLKFATNMHSVIKSEFDNFDIMANKNIGTMFLSLLQIVNCIKKMECIIKTEQTENVPLPISRQHFIDRLYWCLEKLYKALKSLQKYINTQQFHKFLEEYTFSELMDLILDYLEPFASYIDQKEEAYVIDGDAIFVSGEIRTLMDYVLKHTLAFANVALKDDQMALGALCEKVFRATVSFKNECYLSMHGTVNVSVRKLKGITLENAVFHLEDYLNESVLRLVFTCFLDFDRLSIDKLRTIIRVSKEGDPILDELIADFDVNLDRVAQIGIFAVGFAHSIKMKTTILSCLASFESLDSCIIPALHKKYSNDLHAELLEDHFNEEVTNFKNAIQEIVDSYAFTACYLDMVHACITRMQKNFDKLQLENLAQMGEFLYDHFQKEIHNRELQKYSNRRKLFEKFTLILRECQAILFCAAQVETDRILKRFKILRSILQQFLKTFVDRTRPVRKKNVFLSCDSTADSKMKLDSAHSTVNENVVKKMHKHRDSASLESNCFKSPYKPPSSSVLTSQPTPSSSTNSGHPLQKFPNPRKNESMRTAMFKRQKLAESEAAYSIYKNNSSNLEISEILEKLVEMSSNFSNDSYGD